MTTSEDVRRVDPELQPGRAVMGVSIADGLHLKLTPIEKGDRCDLAPWRLLSEVADRSGPKSNHLSPRCI